MAGEGLSSGHVGPRFARLHLPTTTHTEYLRPPLPPACVCVYVSVCVQGPANVEAICLLVELGADVEATLAQRSLETPLHVAARSGRADVIERLLKCPQARVLLLPLC